MISSYLSAEMVVVSGGGFGRSGAFPLRTPQWSKMGPSQAIPRLTLITVSCKEALCL